mmetsp:Transcript_45771/g.80012  ORF Transcript_45771/g.80012 Transcript_45771/m.80012 type:complete len:245 (-) Transcript_45771:1890-2624(-)
MHQQGKLHAGDEARGQRELECLQHALADDGGLHRAAFQHLLHKTTVRSVIAENVVVFGFHFFFCVSIGFSQYDWRFCGLLRLLLLLCLLLGGSEIELFRIANRHFYALHSVGVVRCVQFVQMVGGLFHHARADLRVPKPCAFGHRAPFFFVCSKLFEDAAALLVCRHAQSVHEAEQSKVRDLCVHHGDRIDVYKIEVKFAFGGEVFQPFFGKHDVFAIIHTIAETHPVSILTGVTQVEFLPVVH